MSEEKPLGSISGVALKTIADISRALSIDVLTAEVQNTSLRLRGVDPAHVMLISADIAITDGPEGAEEICISQLDFSEVAKVFKGSEEATLSMKGNQFFVKRGRMRRALSILDKSDVQTPKIPTLQWKWSASIDPEFLRDSVRFSEPVSDHLTLSGNAGVLRYVAENERAGMFENECDVEDAGEEFSTIFSHDYFKAIVNFAKGGVMNLECAEDYPIKFTMEIPGGTAEALLAPRIERRD